MITHAHTYTHNNVPTLKGVGVKGFVGERLRNRPLRVSASYDHEGKHRYSPVHITTKTAMFLSKDPLKLLHSFWNTMWVLMTHHYIYNIVYT